ncbi:MAG: hypothetical protein PHN88_12000 [Ignavibacteria bacterium]|nr:hypothetical protein [Ignavibacteria bacterium]
MKKLYLSLVISVLLISTEIFSQTRENYDYLINPRHDFYSLNYQSAVNAGKGYTGIASSGDIMSTSLNPASLDIPQKFNFYTGYIFKSNLDSKTSNLIDNAGFVHPTASIGFGCRLNKNFQAGFVYRNDRNIEYTHNNYTVYVGNEDNDYSLVFTSHTFSIPLTYEYKFLKFGINANLVLLHSRQKFYDNFANQNTDASLNKLRFIPDFGIRVKLNDFISAGLTYTPGIEQDLSGDSTSTINYRSNNKTYFPAKIGAGVEIGLLNNTLMLSADYRFERTSVFQNYQDVDTSNIYKDRHNINFGAEYKVDKNFVLRTGFFTFLDNNKVKSFVKNDDQYFMTFGAGYEYKNMKVNASMMSSSIIKSANVGHNLYNIGVSYGF